MSLERRQVLEMLAAGQITADEAERLLAALDGRAAASGASQTETPRRRPKYLRVCVDTDDSHGGPTKVNVRVPLQLLRAGVRLSSVIPPHAREKVNRAMAEHGVDFDINQLKPENLEDLIEQLNELTVDVDQERTKVRIFAE